MNKPFGETDQGVKLYKVKNGMCDVYVAVAEEQQYTGSLKQISVSVAPGLGCH